MDNLEDKQKLKDYLLKRTHISSTGCWRFIGAHDKNGYGRIQVNHKLWEVHRLSAYIHHDLDLSKTNDMALHKTHCEHKDCWNPRHIYVGSYSDNMRDAVITRTHVSSAKTHCPAGHKYTVDNTHLTPAGHRQCKECARTRARVKYRILHGVSK